MKNAWLPLKTFQRAELEPPSLIAMRKLSKRDVEALLTEYDNNPVSSLHAALGVLIPNCPEEWEEAVNLLSIDESKKQLLRHGNVVALDALVKQLVETRCL
jgi:hypothetical protein